MASFIKRFNRMQTLAKVVVVSTAALLVATMVLIAVGSPIAPVFGIATLLPFPAALVYER